MDDRLTQASSVLVLGQLRLDASHIASKHRRPRCPAENGARARTTHSKAKRPSGQTSAEGVARDADSRLTTQALHHLTNTIGGECALLADPQSVAAVDRVRLTLHEIAEQMARCLRVKRDPA